MLKATDLKIGQKLRATKDYPHWFNKGDIVEVSYTPRFDDSQVTVKGVIPGGAWFGADGAFDISYFELPEEKPEASFDPTKPVRTRDGRQARIITTDRKGDRPILALVEDRDDPNEEWSIITYPDGRAYLDMESASDLINTPETRSGWFNFYDNKSLAPDGPYPTEEEARKAFRDLKKFAIVSLEIERNIE